MDDLGTCIECGNPATCFCCECDAPLCDECEQDGLCSICRTNQPEYEAMDKEYRLDAFGIYEYDNGALLAYVSKGHHEVEDFVKEVSRECALDNPIDTERVRQRYARWQPNWIDGEYQGQALYLTAKRGRGIFPVTVSWDF